jgi:NAD(P)-dependent dehydrogenase (short-subunit alcohol dehydrogenase family)
MSAAANSGTKADMKGKTCLVTGASSGIGWETALGLAKLGARVVITGRDEARTRAAAESIQKASGGALVDYLLADLSSLAEVRRLAAEVRRLYPKLDVLVNNAGGIFMTREVTKDGFEHTWALNHLAYVLLTQELLGTLKNSAPARIVNVASLAHRNGRMDFADLQGEKSFSGMAIYARTKLANIMFTYALARRLQGTGVTANCLHPGVIASGFGLNNTGWMKTLVKIMQPFLISSAEGALTSIYLASSPDVADVSGKYFVKCKPAVSTPASRDEAAQEKLWQLSLEQCGIKEEAIPQARAAGG